jgi:putative colanic acid biosynthesis acetyltransferase WcaF
MYKVYTPTQTTPFSKPVKILIRVWPIVWLVFARPTPWFLYRWRNVLLKMFGANISWKAKISSSARIDCPWNLIIADYASVGDRAWIYALAPICLKSYACVGQDAKLITGSHDIRSSEFNMTTGSITIEDGAWVAASAIILPNVTIGKYSVVGAGAVVAKNYGPNIIIVGNPAITKGNRFN